MQRDTDIPESRPCFDGHGSAYPATGVLQEQQQLLLAQRLTMLSETYTQRILDLASQRGLLRASDLDAIGSPRVILTRMTAAGLLERVGRGLYRLPGAQVTEFESLALVATRVPQAVFCLLTALQFHGLTTQLPRQVWIAMPRGSHPPRIDCPPIRMVQVAGSAHLAGVEVRLRNGVKVRIYSPARPWSIASNIATRSVWMWRRKP